MELPIISRIRHEFKGRQDGCTDQEIAALRALQGVTCLPEVYRQLLVLMGQTLDDFFRGNQASTWGLMRGLKKEFLEEEIRPAGLTVPDDIFMFSTGAGISWLFFRTKGCEDDPIVYQYIEWEEAFRKLENSLSEYLAIILGGGYKQENAKSPQYFLYDAELDEFYPVEQP